MITTDLPTTTALLATLVEHNLLSAEGLDRVRDHLRACPDLGSDEMVTFLLKEDLLTRFQVDRLLEEQARMLVLPSFTLVDVIGSGSMGTVYKARSTKDEGWYAVKIVPRRNVINIKSIAEKVEALKQVRHPRVSAMVHVGAQGERAYMVWPMLEGGEKLDSLIQKNGPLSPKQAAQIGLQVAMGLQAYHHLDLFHGLLKASDVLIGADRRVRLLDFGVGFLLTCERGKALLDTMTNSKALARGLDCASPEAIMDPLNRTTAGDQYSLGCILYLCLTGRYPFNDANPVKKMLAHQTAEPKPVRELCPTCSPKLAALVKRLLRKQPEERFESIDELIAQLQPLTSDSRNGTSMMSGSGRTTPLPVPALRKEGPVKPSEPLEKVRKSQTAQARGEGRWGWALAACGCVGVVGGMLAWLLANQ
jgi:serine/threonine protein kinase